MSNPTQITSLRIPTETLTAARTLTEKDSGKTFLLSAAAGFTVQLPAVASAGNGFFVDFIVKTAVTSNGYIITELVGTDTNVLTGGVVERETDTNDDGPYSAAFTLITLVANLAVAGDTIHIKSDGVRYYVTGVTNADGAVTVT